MMAHTAGKCLDAEKNKRGKAMLAQIRSASFREWVLPNQDLTICAAIKTNRPGYATADCYIESNNVKVCSAELFFAFLPYDKMANNYVDEVLQSYLAANPLGK